MVVRLVDFEYGAYRHALYDVTAWDVLCPLPEDLVTLVRETHRVALAATWPAAHDEARYHEAWAALASFRALALLNWIPAGSLEADRPWVEDWSARQAVLAALFRLWRNASTVLSLAALGRAAERAFHALAARWPEIGAEKGEAAFLPHWPALSSVNNER
jgi:hypothetical protein